MLPRNDIVVLDLVPRTPRTLKEFGAATEQLAQSALYMRLHLVEKPVVRTVDEEDPNTGEMFELHYAEYVTELASRTRVELEAGFLEGLHRLGVKRGSVRVSVCLGRDLHSVQVSFFNRDGRELTQLHELWELTHQWEEGP